MRSPDEKGRTKQSSRTSSGRASYADESERDLPLKAQMRRLFWTMGCTTSLDVKLRAYITGEQRATGPQEFTDLDVLSIGFSPSGKPHLTLADCKTARARAVERMFWLRGVSEFFVADEAFMVRSNAVPAAARTLSTRLGVGVVDPDDLRSLTKTYHSPVDLEGPLRCLFDVDSIRRHMENMSGLDRRLDSLVDFVRFDYWVYEPFRNLTQVVAHLAEAAPALNPSQPRHLGIFFQAAWQYAFTLARSTYTIRTSRMAEIPIAVESYVAGGELALREKAQLGILLHRAGISVDPRSGILPPYIEQLTELVTRVINKPAETGEILRYAEFLATAVVVGESATVAAAFGSTNVRPVAAKLLADICGFLVTAAGLRPEFRAAARARLVADLTGGAETSAVSTVGIAGRVPSPFVSDDQANPAQLVLPPIKKE